MGRRVPAGRRAARRAGEGAPGAQLLGHEVGAPRAWRLGRKRGSVQGREGNEEVWRFCLPGGRGRRRRRKQQTGGAAGEPRHLPWRGRRQMRMLEPERKRACLGIPARSSPRAPPWDPQETPMGQEGQKGQTPKSSPCTSHTWGRQGVQQKRRAPGHICFTDPEWTGGPACQLES